MLRKTKKEQKNIYVFMYRLKSVYAYLSERVKWKCAGLGAGRGKPPGLSRLSAVVHEQDFYAASMNHFFLYRLDVQNPSRLYYWDYFVKGWMNPFFLYPLMHKNFQVYIALIISKNKKGEMQIYSDIKRSLLPNHGGKLDVVIASLS